MVTDLELLLSDETTPVLQKKSVITEMEGCGFELTSTALQREKVTPGL